MAKVRGLSDILTYFRRNEKPIFFVSPTAFNLLGVEKFINRFFHIILRNRGERSLGL